MIHSEEMVVYCGSEESRQLAGKVIKMTNQLRPDQKNLSISHMDFRNWRDGEWNDKFANTDNIAGKHAIIFLSTDTEELGFKLLQFAWALKNQYSAASLTAVVPFMLYRRQDHGEQNDRINRNLMIISMLKDNGVDKLIVCDIHSKKTIENGRSVGLKVINVDPTKAYIKALSEIREEADEKGKKIRVFSPDLGSLARSVALARELDYSVILSLKTRDTTGKVGIVQSGEKDEARLAELRKKHSYGKICYANDELIHDSIIIMREDEICTGGTARTTGLMLKKMGAYKLILCGTHPVLADEWKEQIFDNTPFDLILCGNTIHRGYRNTTGGLKKDVDMSGLIGHQLAEVLEAA
ncbi:ribose-phosphate pyrophosphokinase-like domain-containing protein [bacterium]|nr:ribose-phosphate pyrophosphokinase-like domain-containing protein [bacterium]